MSWAGTILFLIDRHIFPDYSFVSHVICAAQADAIRHATAKALQAFVEVLPPFHHLHPSQLEGVNGIRLLLKRAGLLTRDARKVERKKVFHRKARKKYQWVKR